MTPSPVSPSRAALAVVRPAVLFTIALLLACPSGPADDPAPAGAAEGTATSSTEPAPPRSQSPLSPAEIDSAEAAVVSASLEPRDLAPVIRTAADDRLPDVITFEFARAVAAPSQVGGPAIEGTAVTVTPETDGELRYSSVSTLTFRPLSPLLPDTKYTVSLGAVATPHAVLRAPAQDATWAHSFTTPGFRVVRADWRNVSVSEGRASIDVVFSGPVSIEAAREHLKVSVNGNELSNLKVQASSDPNAVRIPFGGPILVAGARFSVRVAKGVPLLGADGVSAPASRHDLAFPGAPPMEVVAMRRMEGPSGFFIEVICRDDAAPSGWNGFWDDATDTWFDLTTRCLPTDESAAELISVSPRTKVRIAPSRTGFRILGDFTRGAYTVTLRGGLATTDGGVLPGTVSDAFAIPARSAQVQFVSKGRYLPASAWTAVPVKHLNLSEVQVQIRHVPERNLVHWLTGEDERADATTSDLLVDVRLPVQGPADDFGTTWLDLAKLVPERDKGVYEIRVAGAESSDTSRVLVTGLHLLAKRAATAPDTPHSPRIDVWAVDADELTPAKSTTVDVRRQSGTVLATCVTANTGHCRLDVPIDGVDSEAPYVIVARKDDDLTYLRFADLQTPTSESEVSGDSYLAAEAYRVAPYSDRGVYRPGETAHIVAIARDTNRLAPPAGMPVQVSIIDPRGRTMGRHALATDAAGLIAHDVELGDYAVTGQYTARFQVGDDVLASYGFHVEEFVPERMEVTASVGEPHLLAGETVATDISARYLFGGTAEGSAVELSCELVPGAFKPKDNGQFRYGPWRGTWEGEARGLSLGSAAGELDKDGATRLDCPALSDDVTFEGTGTLVARVAVFEAGSGRSTQTTANAQLHPERYYIGLDTGTEQAKGGEPIQVKGVVVDWTGKLVTDVSEVTLLAARLEDEYGWWYDDEDGYGSQQRYQRRVAEGEATVKVSGGTFSWTVTPEADGAGYLIEARAGEALTGLKLDGTSNYWWWSAPDESVDVTPKPLRPGTLTLELPKTIRLNKKSTVKFTAPYGGRALLAVETHEVSTWEWIDVDPGPNSWSFELEEFSPNVYVSALLLKDPHADSEQTYMPDRAFGVGSVRVDAQRYTQEIELTAPEEIRPNSTLTIDLKLPGADTGTVVTVAAVDEGILQLTSFKTPDPLRALLAKRALGVDSFETIGWSILVPPEGATSPTGGDGDGSADLGRVQPVEPVALWSGVVAVVEGKAQVQLDVPQYRGKLRIMAVAAGPQAVGRAEASVLVRDPLVVQSTLPRFLTDGDRFEVPVHLTNMSGAPRKIAIKLVAEELVAFDGPAGARAESAIDVARPTIQYLQLGIGEAGTVVFDATARRKVGAAKLAVIATSDDLMSRADSVVPFVPADPRTRQLHKVELVAGVNDLSPYLTGWVPTTERTTVRVTSNPYGDVFDHLTFLVRYPYGCIEQTTSSTRPMLFVDRLMEQIDPEMAADGGIQKRVKHGIRRVLSMQTSSGGFAYWPGSDSPQAWGTAYATHMLLDAREVGYDVPQQTIDEALSFMEGQVDQGKDDGWRRGTPYMHYVLARAGRGRKAQASRELAKLAGVSRDGLADESTYMLKAALWHAGDRRYEGDLKSPDVSPVTQERRNGWSFYSDRRRRALTLTVFGEMFGSDEAGEELAGLVANALQGQRSGYYTTQELMWGVTGLGRRVSAGSKEFSVPTLTAGGAEVAARWTDRDSSERAWEIARLGERGAVSVTVADPGKGTLYALVSSEGVQEEAAWDVGGDGLRVARSYLDSEGAAIDPTSVQLGDLVIVRLDITNLTAERMANVALVDRLPAGFEIENANLGRGRVLDVVDPDDLWSLDHMNVRDDRIEAFGALPQASKARTLVYAVRATTAGDFMVPPVEAEAMYDPRNWARQAGDRIVVVGPWTAVAGE